MSLKPIGNFTYLSNNISSAEIDANIHLMKEWTSINRLSVVSKSDPFNKIKLHFCKDVAILQYGCTK